MKRPYGFDHSEHLSLHNLVWTIIHFFDTSRNDYAVWVLKRGLHVYLPLFR